MSGVATVDEARRITRRVVGRRKGLCGDKLDTAFFECSCLLGIAEGTLRTLFTQCRSVKSVTAEIYVRLKQADDALEQIARAERQATKDVADDLERRGHPAAGLARKIAQMADKTE